MLSGEKLCVICEVVVHIEGVRGIYGFPLFSEGVSRVLGVCEDRCCLLRKVPFLSLFLPHRERERERVKEEARREDKSAYRLKTPSFCRGHSSRDSLVCLGSHGSSFDRPNVLLWIQVFCY